MSKLISTFRQRGEMLHKPNGRFWEIKETASSSSYENKLRSRIFGGKDKSSLGPCRKPVLYWLRTPNQTNGHIWSIRFSRAHPIVAQCGGDLGTQVRRISGYLAWHYDSSCSFYLTALCDGDLKFCFFLLLFVLWWYLYTLKATDDSRWLRKNIKL